MNAPIHPHFVHFVIALFTFSVLFDIAGFFMQKKYFQMAAWYNLIFAGFFSLMAIFTGLVDESKLSVSGPALSVMQRHETLAFVSSALIWLLLLWRIGLKGAIPARQKLYLLSGILALALLSWGAYEGGQLVYTYGVHTKRKNRIENGNAAGDSLRKNIRSKITFEGIEDDSEEQQQVTKNGKK